MGVLPFNFGELERMNNIQIEELFFKRTTEHINRVKLNALTIYRHDPMRFKLLLSQAEKHDTSKFEEPEFTPYIQLSYYYMCKNKGIEYETSSDIKEQIIDAVFHHIKNNKHHPEYYFDSTKRERHDQIIDARRMPIISIAEMVCDWKAMSQELDNSVVDFANTVINKKYTFSSEQVILIYELIGALKNG
jgi:hypothetical protein